LNASEILKQYWGHDTFRPLQQEIIDAVLEGKDVLALLPTGGGKSICFQVPALMKEGICLVVSPLIALMKDQVEKLQRSGIPALSIYSGMSFKEVRQTLIRAASGDYKFLYLSPERLETKLFLEFLPSLPVNLLAVDEAHCISQWGYDFRPPYTRIAAIRETLKGVPVLALTASATRLVQDDICDKLAFGKQQQRFQQSFERPNLSYSVFNTASRQNKLLEILNNVPGSAIVYCKSRRHTKEIAELLTLHNIPADHYHAGLGNEARNKKQESWINNSCRVIVSTNAFGMGIDKPDVRVVVHYDVPDCVENYYQEAGRAGRDGKKAYAVLLYTGKELERLQEQADTRFPGTAALKNIYIALMNHLQVEAGSGEGRTYDLDIEAFCRAFKLDLVSTTYALKTLEQEDLFSYNDFFFRPSTVMIGSSRNELEDFEKQHPALEPVIKGLLRSYEGILDFPATVYESRLAKFLRMSVEELKASLKKMHGYGILQYNEQKETPQLFLLQNRMYADNYQIDAAGYLKRKEAFVKRVAAIVDYIKDGSRCRSQVIAGYFTGTEGAACGICDNCLNNKTITVSATEFTAISASIMELLSQEQLTIQQLTDKLRNIKKEKLWKVLDYLQSEQKINADREGYIKIL